VFGGSQRPGDLISTQESGGSLDIVAAGEAIDAPVVEAHRYIEQKRVASGEIEINHTGQAPLLEQHVVAEEIAVHETARKRSIARAAPALEPRPKRRGMRGERRILRNGDAIVETVAKV